MGTPAERLDDGVCTLRDGRRLARSRWGKPDGRDVLFFRGNPGSRFFRLDQKALDVHGATLLTVDRPGVGDSDPRPGRRMVDWPDDVDASSRSVYPTDGSGPGRDWATSRPGPSTMSYWVPSSMADSQRRVI